MSGHCRDLISFLLLRAAESHRLCFFREQQLLVVPTFVLCDVRLDHEEFFSSPSHPLLVY